MAIHYWTSFSDVVYWHPDTFPFVLVYKWGLNQADQIITILL